MRLRDCSMIRHAIMPNAESRKGRAAGRGYDCSNRDHGWLCRRKLRVAAQEERSPEDGSDMSASSPSGLGGTSSFYSVPSGQQEPTGAPRRCTKADEK